MAYVLRTNNISHEIEECPSLLTVPADNNETTDFQVKANIEGYVELYDPSGQLPSIEIGVGKCDIGEVEVNGWNKSNIKVVEESATKSIAGNEKININYTGKISARYKAEPIKVTSENASSTPTPEATDLGTQSSLKFSVPISYTHSESKETYSETVNVYLSSIDISQDPAEIEIDTTMPESSVSVDNPGGVEVSDDGTIKITEPEVTTSGTDTSTSKKNLALELQGDQYKINLDKIFGSLGPIKLPDWLILNLVAIETNWYSQVTYIPAQLISISNDLFIIAKDMIEYSLKYAAAKAICIQQGEANYKKVMNGGEDNLIRLEDYTQYTDYALSDGFVDEVTITTRTIYGEPWNPVLFIAQKEYKYNALKLIESALNFVTYTSNPRFLGINVLNISGVSELLNFLKFNPQTRKYQFVWDDPEEFEFMKWIYHDQKFNKKLTKALQQLNGEVGLNKILESKTVANYADYIAQYEYIDPNTNKIYSDRVRPLERFIWAAGDVIAGSTPFTLASSEIFVNEFFTRSKAIDMINDFIHGLTKAKEAIERVPKDIQDLAKSIMEPMGAVVVTPLGAGAVATNPLQIAGGLLRVKSSLSQLKTDIGIPLNLLDSLGVPMSYLMPVKIVYDLLDSIV